MVIIVSHQFLLRLIIPNVEPFLHPWINRFQRPLIVSIRQYFSQQIRVKCKYLLTSLCQKDYTYNVTTVHLDKSNRFIDMTVYLLMADLKFFPVRVKKKYYILKF